MAIPGSGQVPLSLRVSAAEKNAAIQAATESGRSLSSEVEYRLRWYRDQESRLGGRRVMHMLLALAEMAQSQYPEGDNWLDDKDLYFDVANEWHRAIDAFAPIDTDAEIARGERLIEMLPDADPRLAPRLRLMLLRTSRLSGLPEAARAKFAAAAAGETDYEPRDPVADAEREYHQSKGLFAAEPAGRAFLTAWAFARAEVVASGQAPTAATIALHFASTPELVALGEIGTASSVEDVLDLRDKILRPPPLSDP